MICTQCCETIEERHYEIGLEVLCRGCANALDGLWAAEAADYPLTEDSGGETTCPVCGEAVSEDELLETSKGTSCKYCLAAWTAAEMADELL